MWTMSGHCQNLGKSIQVAARVDLAPPPVCPLFQRICFYWISLYFLSDLLPRVISYLSRHVFGFFKAPFPIGFLSIFYWICSQEKFYICHNMTSAVESTGKFYSIEKHKFLLDLTTFFSLVTYRWLWHKLSFQRGAFMSCCSPISQFFWGEPQVGESTLQSPVLHSFSYSTTSQFLFSSGDALALVKHLG